MSANKGSLSEAFGELAKDHPEIAQRIDRFDRESRSILEQHHDDVMDDSENGIWMVIAMIVAFSIAAAWLAATMDLHPGI